MNSRPHAILVSTAAELIDGLRPGGKLLADLSKDFRYSKSSHFFFRGEWSSRWKLTPTAFRDETRLFNEFTGNWVAPSSDAHEQIVLEAATLWRYISLCDDVGIALPEDGQTLRAAFTYYRNLHWYKVRQENTLSSISKRFRDQTWPPLEVLSTIAFAQHSGVPTRLLDFTDDPFVALYFAARGCLSHENTEGNMAIWCFPESLIMDQFDRSAPQHFLPSEQRLQIVTAPSAMDANLRAQRGLFLLDKKPIDTFGRVSNPDNLLDSLPMGSNPAIKFEVPQSEARQVLDTLKKLYRYSTATLFPTAEGVARALTEDHRPAAQSTEKD